MTRTANASWKLWQKPAERLIGRFLHTGSPNHPLRRAESKRPGTCQRFCYQNSCSVLNPASIYI